MSDDLVSTGLAALVPVTAPVTEALVPAVVPAIPLPTAPLPEGWTVHRVAALVRDLVTNIYELPFTLKTHRLTQEQYNELSTNEFFKRALETATIEWNSPLSTNKRLAMEAAIALEDALPDVAARLKKSNEPLPGVVALCNVFAKMAGIGEAARQDGVGTERFKITINLGADTFSAEKTRPTITVGRESEGAGETTTLSALVGKA